MKRLSAGAAAFAAAGMLVLLYAAVLSFFVRLASGLLLTALLGETCLTDLQNARSCCLRACFTSR